MKNVESVPNFYQLNNEIKNIGSIYGAEIMPSILAWEKFNFTHELFQKKPKQGFFLWIKKSISLPIQTLIEIDSKNILQEMSNLIIIEKDLNVKLSSFCRSKKEIKGKHFALAKIILKENSVLDYVQNNSFKKEDEFNAHYEFFLNKGSKLKSKIMNQSNGAIIKTREDVYLLQEKASADLRIKMIADNKGTFFSESYMHGEDEVKGHLECSGLIAHKDSKIVSIPGIICNSNKAELTHEASIGKISEEKLMYLRMRGLSEKKATELIIKSFLNS